jgi:hypothetical protein
VSTGGGVLAEAEGIEAKVARGLVSVVDLLVGERLKGANEHDCVNVYMCVCVWKANRVLRPSTNKQDKRPNLPEDQSIAKMKRRSTHRSEPRHRERAARRR